MSIVLCESCKRQIAGDAADTVDSAAEPHHCVLCFGILDATFVKEVTA